MQREEKLVGQWFGALLAPGADGLRLEWRDPRQAVVPERHMLMRYDDGS